MTTIYIEELDNVDSGEVIRTIFDREDVALAEAGSDILAAMSDNWDLNDEGERDAARSIQDDIRSSNYRDAIREYNDYEANRSTNYPVFIRVQSETLKQSANKHYYINFADYELEEEEEEEEETEFVDNSPYQASSPGATCRGPCGNPSTDAYADKRDGTYVCYQCKLFSGVFGKP